MVKRIMAVFLLAFILIQPGTSATVQTSLPVWDSDYLTDVRNQAEKSWGRLEAASGEVVTVSENMLRLRTPSGAVVDQPVFPGASVFINRYCSTLALLAPVQGAPFFVRCFVEPGGRAVIVESSFQGIECDLIGRFPGGLRVRCDDGSVHDLRVWPGYQLIHLPSPLSRRPGRCFVLLDMENQVRRVWI